MDIYIPDNKVMKEAFEIINEVYSSEELEKFIMKCLKKYRQHTEYGNGGWYQIQDYVNKQYVKEKQDLENENV